VYATIKELSGGQTRTVCGGVGAEETEVYLSLNNTVDVRIVGKRTSEEEHNTFMLMYQGSFLMLMYQGSCIMLMYQGSCIMLMYQGSFLSFLLLI